MDCWKSQSTIEHRKQRPDWFETLRDDICLDLEAA